MRVRRRLVLGGGISLAAGFSARKSSADPQIGQLQLTSPPRPVPGLGFTDGAAVGHHLAEFAGQGVVLNFWATWCGPCVQEMPSLARLAAALRPDRIVVIPISADTGGATAVNAFYQAHRLGGLGVWLDPQGGLLSAIGGLGLPTTLILNRAGREVARIAGAADWMAPETLRTVRALCNM